MLESAKAAAEEAAAEREAAALVYKRDTIAFSPEEHVEQINALHKELSEEKKSSKIISERLDEITKQNPEKNERSIESNKEVTRQREISLEKEQYYARVLEEHKVANQSGSMKGLQMQSIVNQLKLELSDVETTLALTKQNADWQEKVNHDMGTKTLALEQEAIVAARKCLDLNIASQNDKEMLQQQSLELQKYKETNQ